MTLEHRQMDASLMSCALTDASQWPSNAKKPPRRPHSPEKPFDVEIRGDQGRSGEISRPHSPEKPFDVECIVTSCQSR